MTTATATAPSQSHNGNIGEIFKFLRISLIWLAIIFGAVWLASWAVGAVIPSLIEMSAPKNAFAINIANMIRLLTPIVAVMVFIPINACFMVLAERRGLALLTVRKGPNRVGPDGFLQTAADAVKLLFKENIDPHGCDTVMFTMAPVIFFAPSVFGALPLLAAVTSDHDLFHIVNLPTGIFYVLAMSSIPVVGIVMGGWASNNKYSLVGGLRSAAQAISYEIPLVLAIISVCLQVGSLNVVDISWMQNPMELAKLTVGADGLNRWNPLHVDTQLMRDIGTLGVDSLGNWGFFNWNIMGGDTVSSFLSLVVAGKITGGAAVGKGIAAALLVLCNWLLCGLYMLGACAEINRIPFDLPEAESELVSGYNTEYSGIRFAIYFLAEFTNLFIVATIAVVMWFGAGASPFPSSFYEPVMKVFDLISNEANRLLATVQLPAILNATVLSGALWAIAKVYFIVYFAILVRGTLPRFRIDQLMDFGWKRLIPLALILLLAVTYLKELI